MTSLRIDMAADRSRSRAARRERIQVDASAVCRGLETLRDDHRSCLKSLEALVHEGKSDVSPVERQKIEMLNDSIRQIESGLDEAKVSERTSLQTAPSRLISRKKKGFLCAIASLERSRSRKAQTAIASQTIVPGKRVAARRTRRGASQVGRTRIATRRTRRTTQSGQLHAPSQKRRRNRRRYH